MSKSSSSAAATITTTTASIPSTSGVVNPSLSTTNKSSKIKLSPAANTQAAAAAINIKFSIEETKANLRAKISQNLNNLVELTRSTVRTSETNELFKQCFKQFVANEPAIEASVDKLKKVEIISTQLNYQIEAIHKDCEQLKDVSHQISSIQQLKKRSKSAE